MRRFGIPATTAAAQLQRDDATAQTFFRLPEPTGKPPFRVRSDELEIPTATGPRSFLVMGDHGGVKDPHPQLAVAGAMAANPADFAYSVGDVDYFTGEEGEYQPQFFEAYANYPRPIVAIPGNHDGAGNDKLASFMRYFCDTEARLLPEVEEYHRDTVTQPNCYWTLLDSAVTIVGLYSNVPSGGVIEADQYEWLVGELREALAGVPLIVALHHPPYSIDAHHGGSAKMGGLLDEAFKSAGRVPQLVLAGHVHDYQRFSRIVFDRPVTYVVVGNGGYHNLHRFAPGATAGEEVSQGVTFEAGDDKHWGFLRLTIDGQQIHGASTPVERDGTVIEAGDTFTC